MLGSDGVGGSGYDRRFRYLPGAGEIRGLMCVLSMGIQGFIV